MILHVYSLRDRKAEVFTRPVFVGALGQLIREIQTIVRSGSDEMLAKYPEDFSLYKLATFDDQRGTFMVLALPDFVLDVSSLLPVGQGGSEAPVAPSGGA